MDRLQVLFLVMVGMGLMWLVWQGAKLWLRRGIQVQGVASEDDQPVLLYFSSATCAPCRLQQAPTIDSLRQAMGEQAQFEEYDALENPDLASRFRVLTVPTTVVLAPCGDVVAVNYGVTGADKLRQQLNSAVSVCA